MGAARSGRRGASAGARGRRPERVDGEVRTAGAVGRVRRSPRGRWVPPARAVGRRPTCPITCGIARPPERMDTHRADRSVVGQAPPGARGRWVRGGVRPPERVDGGCRAAGSAGASSLDVGRRVVLSFGASAKLLVSIRHARLHVGSHAIRIVSGTVTTKRSAELLVGAGHVQSHVGSRCDSHPVRHADDRAKRTRGHVHGAAPRARELPKGHG